MSYTEVLILVAGATPQIITETIYALSRKSPPVYLHEIYIITTSTGKKRIEDTLIRKGILQRLIKEYNLPRIGLTDASFVIVKDISGNAIDDIRDEEQNEAMGDLITSVVQEKAKDPAVRLHGSLAGGRKTMSFYMGAALQIFGRPWDRLYHVLVTPEFETNADFFYKPARNKIIECRLPDGRVKRLNTKDAEINLAELPFIRLRDKLSPSLQGKGFKELIAEGQREIDTAINPPEVIVHLTERIVSIGDIRIRMSPVQLMTYTIFLRLKTDYCIYPRREYCKECTECFSTLIDLKRSPYIEKMITDFKKIYEDRPERVEDWLRRSKNILWEPALRQNISKIKGAIRRHLNNEALLPYYSITNNKQYAGTRYGIRVEKGKIRIV